MIGYRSFQLVSKPTSNSSFGVITIIPCPRGYNKNVAFVPISTRGKVHILTLWIATVHIRKWKMSRPKTQS